MLIQDTTDPSINVGPQPNWTVGVESRPGLDNHMMGTVFEELIRPNGANNEETGNTGRLEMP